MFLLGWLLIRGSALPPTAATTTAVRWQGPLLLVAGHVPHARHLPIACGRHYCSSEHVSAFNPSCWSLGTHHTDDTFRVRTDDTALWSTLLVPAFGRISSPPAGNISHSEVELPKLHPSDVFAPRAASMLHGTSPRVASTSPKIGHRLGLFSVSGL